MQQRLIYQLVANLISQHGAQDETLRACACGFCCSEQAPDIVAWVRTGLLAAAAEIIVAEIQIPDRGGVHETGEFGGASDLGPEYGCRRCRRYLRCHRPQR